MNRTSTEVLKSLAGLGKHRILNNAVLPKKEEISTTDKQNDNNEKEKLVSDGTKSLHDANAENRMTSTKITGSCPRCGIAIAVENSIRAIE